jgi:hypothetical protein
MIAEGTPIISPREADRAMQNFVCRSLCAMALVLAAGLLPDPPPRTDFDGPAGRLADEGAAARAKRLQAQAYADDFNQLVVGDNGPDAALAARTRLERLLASRVATLDRHYRLSRLQKQKLKLAGQGDIRRLEDEIARQREKFVATRLEGVDADVRAAFGEAAALRQSLKTGPFGKGSLFAKAFNTLLEPDQLANSERRRQLAAKSTVKITLDNAATLETAAKLQEEAFRIGWTHRENEIGLLPFGKAVDIRSADKLEPLRKVGEQHRLVGFDFSQDGNFVALTDNSTKAFLLNLATGHEITLDTNSQQPWASFSPDCKLVATGGYGIRAVLWSADSGKRIRDLDVGPQIGGLTPVFSPDGKTLAVGNRNGRTCLFDVATGRLRHKLSLESTQEVRFDPSGKRLAATYVDGNLAVWNVETGELMQRTKARAEELYSLDWSPDGKIIATSGRNAPVTLWRAADLTSLVDIDAPEWVVCVRFNPAGTRLVFAGGSAIMGGPRYVEMLGVPQE